MNKQKRIVTGERPADFVVDKILSPVINWMLILSVASFLFLIVAIVAASVWVVYFK